MGRLAVQGASARAVELHRDALARIRGRIDRRFAQFMLVQLVGTSLVALLLAEATAARPAIPPYLALLVTGFASGAAALLGFRHPGHPVTRHVLAGVQVLWSGVLLQSSLGRVETDLYMFASLALLAFYRDPWVYLSAILVAGFDHGLAALLWPESAHGLLRTDGIRLFEHLVWVTLLIGILIRTGSEQRSDIHVLTEHQARLEQAEKQTRELIENIHATTHERTQELEQKSRSLEDMLEQLRRSEEFSRAVLEKAGDAIITINARLSIVAQNEVASAMFGYEKGELIGRNVSILQLLDGRADDGVDSGADSDRTLLGERREMTARRKNGDEFPVDVFMTRISVGGEPHFVSIVRDLTQERAAEQRLHELNQEIVQASRRAGMADVATGVLHNVGNVLNSVNVSVEFLRSVLQNSKLSHLGRTVELMKQQGDGLGAFVSHDARGRAIVPFLGRLGDSLNRDYREIGREIENLRGYVDHIKAVVAKQQDFARTGEVIEDCDIRALVHDAIALAQAAFEKHRIDVAVRVENTPVVRTDKHKVLQILVNLVSNGWQALSETESDDRRLTIEATVTSERTVAIRVIDNGAGIAEEARQRLFTSGFTTKRDGHGFGLHSSAIAAAELGGNLRCFSAGIGQGATFTLELPLQAAEQAA